METIFSKRKYLVAFIEGDEPFTKQLGLAEILDPTDKNPYEYILAMREELDTILDLKVTDRIPFKFNRDNEFSQGIIKRLF